MPTVAQTAQVRDLKRRIEALSTADALRLCADLLDRGEAAFAETLIEVVLTRVRLDRLRAGAAGRPRSPQG